MKPIISELFYQVMRVIKLMQRGDHTLFANDTLPSPDNDIQICKTTSKLDLDSLVRFLHESGVLRPLQISSKVA